MINQITTLSRERLEQLADENTICKVSWDERIEIARALLAVMDAKPVAFTFSDEFSELNASGIGVCRVWSEECYPDAPVRLYTTPPASRAPDGWIKCSDRMPDGHGYYLTHSSAGVDVTLCQQGKFFHEYATHWMPLPPNPEE